MFGQLERKHGDGRVFTMRYFSHKGMTNK